VPDAIQESVLLRQEPGRHARVADEDDESYEIRECDRPPDDGKC
jgi:hypothetical protein